MLIPAYKFRPGVLHIGLPVVILAVTFAIVFGILRQGERIVATDTPVGSLSASSQTVNLDDPNVSITLAASGLQGVGGAAVKEIRFFVVNPKLAESSAWKNSGPSRCTVGSPPCKANSDDADGDGFSDSDEVAMGTDPNAACPTSTSHAAWPPDINNDGEVDLFNDILGVISKNGSGDMRYDLNVDGKVDEADYWVARGYFGEKCSLETTGVLENDEIYDIGITSTPGSGSELAWDKNARLFVGVDRFLTKNDLQSGMYTIGLRVEDEAGNVNNGAAYITLELGEFGVPDVIPSPSPSGLDITDPDLNPTPTPSPLPSPIPSPSPLPIPEDLVGPLPTTYQYWVHVTGVYDDDGVVSYLGSVADYKNNPILSTSIKMGFRLIEEPNPDGYELLVCSPDCSGGYDSVTYKGPMVFYPNVKLGNVEVTPEGPMTIPGFDQDKDGYTDEAEIRILGTDPNNACSWGPDFDGDGQVSLFGDVLNFLQNFRTGGSRYDVNADGGIGLADFIAMFGHYGETCGS